MTGHLTLVKTYFERAISPCIKLITDHVSRPGVTQQAKLWTALRDFITEFEEGAHRETFSRAIHSRT
jgi:hypothetical protein